MEYECQTSLTKYPNRYDHQIKQFIYNTPKKLNTRFELCHGLVPVNLPILLRRHQMETFPALLAICAGNTPVTGEFPAQRLVTRSFDVIFDLHLNKMLSKQSWCWWFEAPSHPLWRRCNGLSVLLHWHSDVIQSAQSGESNLDDMGK